MPTPCASTLSRRPATMTRLAWLYLPALLWFISTSAPAAVLHLRNGGFVSGDLTDSRQPNVVRWQATAFVSPFEFPLSGLSAVHFPVPPELPRPEGEYCFELAGGDVVFGTLLGMGDNLADIEVPRVGRLRIDRSLINRMYRWRSSVDLIYIGPNGLVGWHEPAAKKAWREEQGQPWTDQDGALIRGDFKLPARATLEFEISWKNKPDFVFALGVGDSEKSTQRRFSVRSLGPRPDRPARGGARGRCCFRGRGIAWARTSSSPCVPRSAERKDARLLGRWQASGRPEGEQHQAGTTWGHLAG